MEKARGTEEALKSPSLPLPLPTMSANVKPESLKPPKYSIVSRREVGTSGQKISLLANHFKVSVKATDAVFYQYTVTISSEDIRVVESKGIGRKLVDKLYQTYSSELAGKRFAYDGEKSLYTVGPLPLNKFEFTIVLEESFAKWSPDADRGPTETGKRTKCSFQSKTYKVELSYSAKIPLKSITLAFKGVESDNSTQDALRVLDIILRQQAADKVCLLVRQSFFQDDSRNYIDMGGGVLDLWGFHSSFHPTRRGLSLNMDVSTTMILRPGPVFEFLKQNLNLNDDRFWPNVRNQKQKILITSCPDIKTIHLNMEFKIIGLSGKPCSELYFPMKVKNGDFGEVSTVDITVYEYFTKHCGIELTYSVDMPCLDVGKPKRPNYLPLERYTKALSSNQRATQAERSRQKPRERIQTLTDALRNNKFNENPVLSACGISIGRQLTEVDGRILKTPRLKVGNHEDCIPRNGRWNFNNKLLGESDVPKFTVVVAQKNQHTKLFQTNAPENVPPVVDSKIVHPRNYDFYVCAHAGMIGTSRPAHYHVLLDEIGFSPNDLQNLIHSLSYVYQRSTTAISIVAPICYAQLAAHQIGQFLKFELVKHLQQT